MRKFPINRTELAKRDIQDIWLGIAVHNPDAATRIVQRIDARIRLLSEFPEPGPERPEVAIGPPALVEGNYLILYRVETDTVLIVRVVHGARDLAALL
ncbi:type II toxin-antitoxin system RelE/ParE family toxin [Mesorhizobium australicum]|uniref:Toxin ParE1/3/4 n=1 Tax=Mesorhizobium australicum TaxID=536018 RepID=A0A1X7P227_9HYPH|nr:type II toxin-antitoxin system RelE/ParE family toxin [Mesorhizobium australicum]SMH44198.1 toxin ParE1/3/4 [Mesorhizobium australicum]